jgi:hypothetical protein
MAESLERECSGVRITAVERADPNRERDVVPLLIWIDFEFLGRHLTRSQPLGRYEVSGRLSEQGDRAGGTVDCEHVAVRSDAVGDLTCRGAGATSDLDHPETRPERQGVDDRLEAR